MIYLIHENNIVVEVLDDIHQEIAFDISLSLTKTLFILAEKFPEELIIWCHKDYFTLINTAELLNIFHHDYIMASYSMSNETYINQKIGYVDQSIFVNIKYNVTYPTWLMSSDVGGISSSFLLSILGQIEKGSDFNYFLNSLGKLAMPKGLFCYSEPRIINEKIEPSGTKNKASIFLMFRFVKEHYKWFWTWFLFIILFLNEKELKVLPFLSSIRFKKLNLNFDKNQIQSKKKIIINKELDVIIPTIGRKKYLYDVLKDLSKQTILPASVIIVEQNPISKSISELDYLDNQQWPFKIKHIFTHQTGACNARNSALDLVESEWIFFADDDIKLPDNFIQFAIEFMVKSRISAASLQCRQPNEKSTKLKFGQWGGFGSGSSIVNTSALKDLKFDTNYEHGFGEDSDFGMQLRNSGTDIFYLPKPEILHLKAASGGFRTKFKQPWDADSIKPKPSPTVLLFHKKHSTQEQLLGYKGILFLKFYRVQAIWNPLTYYRTFKRQWQLSNYWAAMLLKK